MALWSAPDIIITRTSGWHSLTACRTAMPSMPGISTSTSISRGGADSLRYSKTELPLANSLGFSSCEIWENRTKHGPHTGIVINYNDCTVLCSVNTILTGQGSIMQNAAYHFHRHVRPVRRSRRVPVGTSCAELCWQCSEQRRLGLLMTWDQQRSYSDVRLAEWPRAPAPKARIPRRKVSRSLFIRRLCHVAFRNDMGW